MRVVEAPDTYPSANIPTVELPVAEPEQDAALEAVAEAFTSPEYVYLLRVVEAPDAYPSANIPTVALPAAAPLRDAALAAAPDETTHPENVYLSRVVEALGVPPKAKMPTVPAANGVALPLAALNADGPYALLALTVNVYAVQAVKQLTVIGDVVPVPVLNPGLDTAVYEVIAPPPTQLGAVKATQAFWTPAVADPIVGAFATFSELNALIKPPIYRLDITFPCVS